LKHLCGLLKPDGGTVTVDDVNIVPLSEDELAPIRQKFGVLFQGAALFDSMTVFDNVAFPLREQRNSANRRSMNGYVERCKSWIWRRRRTRNPPS